MNRGFINIILIIALIVVVAGGVGYWAMKEQTNSSSDTQPPTLQEDTNTGISDTTNPATTQQNVPTPAKTTTAKQIVVSATINQSSLTSSSQHPILSGTASGVDSVYVNLVDKHGGENFWHAAISVVNGKWSVTLSPNYAIPVGQYSVYINKPEDSQNLDTPLVTGTLTITSSTIQTKAIEDLILKPSEVPSDYIPLKSLTNAGVANPGFYSGEMRTQFLNQFGASSGLVNRIYGVIYKNYSSLDDLDIMVLEYGSSSDLEADLTRMRTKAISEGYANKITFTTKSNYLIVLYDDNSPELANQLTTQLRAKIF